MWLVGEVLAEFLRLQCVGMGHDFNRFQYISVPPFGSELSVHPGRVDLVHDRLALCATHIRCKGHMPVYPILRARVVNVSQ